ncbi:MAG: hypothetical protein WDW38_010810 [Sanguina aurantia]
MSKRDRGNEALDTQAAEETPTSDTKRSRVEQASSGLERGEQVSTQVASSDQIASAPTRTGSTSVPEAADEDGDEYYQPRASSRAAVKKGQECPYLDTISRQNLDFDFEKCCSVSLSPVNVYVCLVCGKYFQGRGLATHAYTHSLESSHHIFMKLDNGKVLARVALIRDFFLVPSLYSSCKSPLVQSFGELLRKLWNTNNYKGQVSPHEFMQAVVASSKKRFTIESSADPVEFWSWLLNSLHLDLTGGKPKKQSIITKCFQGELEVITLAGSGKGKAAGSSDDVVERTPFLLLAQDLPPPPLFKDVLEKNIIPQVPIFHILHKYDGETVLDDIKAGRRRFRITRLPLYLCMHFKRFTKNNFFVDKNPTIVNFPVKNLELHDIIPTPKAKDGSSQPSKYDLIANVVHDGKAGEGTYRVHVHRKAEGIWYELQDLSVIDILPQMVALSEAYFQVYELKKDQG